MKIYELIPNGHNSYSIPSKLKIPRWYTSYEAAKEDLIRIWANGNGISLYSPIIAHEVASEALPFKGVILRAQLEKKPYYVYRGQIRRDTTSPVSFEEVVNGFLTPGSRFVSPAADAPEPEEAIARFELAACPNDVEWALPCTGFVEGILYFYCYMKSFPKLDEDLAEDLIMLAYEAYVSSLLRTRKNHPRPKGRNDGIPRLDKDSIIVHATIPFMTPIGHDRLVIDKRFSYECVNSTEYHVGEDAKIRIRDPHNPVLTKVVSIQSLTAQNLPFEIEDVDCTHFFYNEEPIFSTFYDIYKCAAIVEEYAKYRIQKMLSDRKGET